MAGQGGEEDEINIGMEVVVDPADPNQEPMTTYVEAQVNFMQDNIGMDVLTLCTGG